MALVILRGVISALLCVTLDGQILGRWVFVVDVIRGVILRGIAASCLLGPPSPRVPVLNVQRLTPNRCFAIYNLMASPLPPFPLPLNTVLLIFAPTNR